jgi:predicted RNA-binding protein with PIN domain
MPYLIDGHNLIGRMAGLSLDEPDDEARLLQVLRTFCARRKTKATVYFDRGAPGRANPASVSGLTARFVVPPATADEAIVRHLDRLGGDARNWVVVSSDSDVAKAARRRGARVWSSEDFTRAVAAALAPGPPPEKPDIPPGSDELRDWERLFRSGRRRPG